MRTYKGRKIYECERAKGEHEGKWTVQTYHQSGMPWSDELCPHFQTLRDCKEYVTEQVEQELMWRKRD